MSWEDRETVQGRANKADSCTSPLWYGLRRLEEADSESLSPLTNHYGGDEL